MFYIEKEIAQNTSDYFSYRSNDAKKKNKASGKRVIEMVFSLSQAQVYYLSWEWDFIVGKCNGGIMVAFQIHDWYSGDHNKIVCKDFKIAWPYESYTNKIHKMDEFWYL